LYSNCDNYDLCAACENIHPPVHDQSHVFVKLRYPAPKAGVKHGTFVHLLKSSLYSDKADKTDKADKAKAEKTDKTQTKGSKKE
jgi:hypothetical protein